ncbi:MAG: amino acid permease, partial [Candidatus Aminicenantes bacterium]|nr:amino acid permease [Candidatus Aminicenantes bacterium]
GWFLISAGGILASASALNSTLLSKGRQIFAMGKNGFLPRILGKIHEAKKTPQAALTSGGLLTLVALVFFNLEFIAKSANFCLLVSLLPISLALRKIYRSDESKRPSARWKRFLPEAAFIANLGLLLTLDWISLIFGLQLGGIGAVVYFFYSRKREVRTREGVNIVLAEREKKPFLTFGSRILVPMANPQTQEAIFSISNAFLAHSGGEIIVLSIVDTPEQMDFFSALSTADYSLDIIQRSARLAKLSEVPIRPVIRAARSVPRGIVYAAEEEACNLIIMGYAGRNAAESSSLMEEVLDRSQTDIIFLKLKKLEADFSPKKIAVSLGGRYSPNLDLMVRLADALADYCKGKITFLNILPTDYNDEQKSRTDRIFIEAIQKHSAKALYNIQGLASDSPLETLAEKSVEFDLLIVGTARVGLLERAVVGSFATQIAERSQCSVAVVRVVSTAKKILKKI